MIVRENFDGSYTADLRIRGKGPQLKFDDFDAADLCLSKAKLDANIDAGLDKGRTLAEAAEMFQKSCVFNEFSEYTLASYERWIRNHVVPHLPTYLSQIDASVLASFRDMDRSYLAPAVRLIPLSLLDAILDEAVGEEWLAENPVDSLPEIRRRAAYNRPRNHQRLRLPNEDELESCILRSTGVLNVLICLGGLAGLRLGESLALRWGDVDLDKRKITIRSASKMSGPRAGRQGAPKTKASMRAVPIDKRLLAVLIAFKDEIKPTAEDFVCQDASGAHLGRAEAYSLLGKLLRKLRIVRWQKNIRQNVAAYGFHAFRHACVSRWIYANIPIPTIMRWIGHSHPQTTIDIYAYQIRSAAMVRQRSEGTGGDSSVQ